MKNRILPALAATLALLATADAHALKLAVVGAGNYANGDGSPNASYSAKPSLGGGGLLEIGLVPSIGIEVGALYVPRKYGVVSGASEYTATQNMLQVPVMLRANLLNILSLGVGGYLGKYMGNPQFDLTSSGGQSPSASGISSTDFGMVTSLAFYSTLTPLARFVFDARYVIGSKDNDLSANDRKFRDIQLLIGFQMGL